MIGTLKKLLAHPDTVDLSIDDPRTTDRRQGIIDKNGFLWRIYDEWYRTVADCVPPGSGGVLELGSGAGFLSRYIPGLITSEIFDCPNLRIVLDARRLPFADASLKAIVMVDVFHHIPDSRTFLGEAKRCLRPGGRLVMIEPWVSTWSRQIYTRLHHEPFLPGAEDWRFPESGPLSGANGALPWIVFERDRREFESAFPDFAIQQVRPFMPFRYLVSGGVSMRPLMPARAFRPWRWIESMFSAWPQHWSMFAFIHVERR